jgi:TfoX/Sxy family transcriptional regulator of competence genes
MASKQETVDYIVSQIQAAGVITAKKMFGEYGVYCEEKMVALVADDQLFVKPTIAGRAYLGDPEEAPPYPGAKNWFYISEEIWDDPEWLSGLIRVSTPELTIPKKKKPKSAK